jgi:DNA-3-methyladenine glycosylase II
VIFALKPPLDGDLTIRATAFYSAFGVIRHNTYRRLIRAGNGVALVAFSADVPNTVRAHVLAAHGDVDELLLAAHITHIVNAAADRAPFDDFARQHPALYRTAAPMIGLHPFRFEHVFDALCVTIIEQQISLRAAQLAERWLCAWAGDRLDYDGQTYYTFPSPERLARAALDELTPMKITFIRMRRLLALARAVASGELDIEALRAAPFQVAYTALVALHGVGHWTAAWTLIRAMGQFAYIGRADVALRAAVNRYFFEQPGRADPDVMDALFASYGDYAGMASYYTLMRYAFEKY